MKTKPPVLILISLSSWKRQENLDNLQINVQTCLQFTEDLFRYLFPANPVNALCQYASISYVFASSIQQGWFKAESVIPELFSKAGIMSHPRLAGLSAEQLAYRAIALCRIAQILDSVLYLVSGPSMLRDQTFCPNKFLLDSFSESSFMSSWLFSESRGSPTPVLKRKEGLSKRDVEGKADDSPKEETNHQQEVIVKKTTASRVSPERYKEQLRKVKNKVRTCICSTVSGVYLLKIKDWPVYCCYRRNCLLLVQFTHKITSLLRVWRSWKATGDSKLYVSPESFVIRQGPTKIWPCPANGSIKFGEIFLVHLLMMVN